LYGLTSAELGTPDSVESDLSRTKIISTEFGSTSSTIRIPAGAFLNPTTVDVYTLADNAFAEGRIPDSNVYIISQVIAWRESNGTIPIARSAVQMTITSPSIKVGAIVYSIVDGVVRTTDTATVAGSITIFMTEDPIIVVAEAPVTPPCNCQQQNQNIVVRDPAPVVVEPKKEVVEEAKEEIVVEPKKEVVEEANEEVVEVSVPTPKINRVYKSQLKIYFDLGSATVNAKSLKTISDFLGKLSKNHQRMKITAVGFTQPTLINPYPEALSRARAKSVIQIVKRYGLPAKYQFIGKGNALTNSDKSRYVNLTITRTEAAHA
jgi:outer membrane protein OmpA-like peptidoglycan-associated protein